MIRYYNHVTLLGLQSNAPLCSNNPEFRTSIGLRCWFCGEYLDGSYPTCIAGDYDHAQVQCSIRDIYDMQRYVIPPLSEFHDVDPYPPPVPQPLPPRGCWKDITNLQVGDSSRSLSHETSEVGIEDPDIL